MLRATKGMKNGGDTNVTKRMKKNEKKKGDRGKLLWQCFLNKILYTRKYPLAGVK